MKLGASVLPLLAFPVATQAFSPANVAFSPPRTPSALSMAREGGNDANLGDAARAAASTFAASVLLASSVMVGPMNLDGAGVPPAFAAAPAAEVATPKKNAKKDAKKEVATPVPAKKGGKKDAAPAPAGKARRA